ncbi:MAG: hypothetical protein U0838_00610 [Chloroflexota bacterium]
MDRRTARSIAFDLVDTDLADRAAHQARRGPHARPAARRVQPRRPRPGEDLRDVLGEVTSGDGIRITTYRSWSPRPAPDVFDPVFRAMLLFGVAVPGLRRAGQAARRRSSRRPGSRSSSTRTGC